MAEIEHFLNTTDDDILSPSLLANIENGAKMLMSHIKKDDDILIFPDPDCDGFTSAALLINYLYTLFPAYVSNHVSYQLQEGKEHGVNPDKVGDNIKLVIAPDSSSNSVDECAILAARGINVLILDHHLVDTPAKDACIINNQLCDYPTKTLSGVGIVYKFCSYLDELINIKKADDFLDLVALGCVADMVSLNEFETVHLIRKGVKQIKNPFFQAMVNKQSYSLKGEVTPFGISFYIAPYVNATIRLGTQEEKLVLFESMLEHKALEKIPSTKRGEKGKFETRVTQACRNCANIKNRQTKSRDEDVEKIKKIIEANNLNENKILMICNEEVELDKNLTGLIANQLMSEYKKPVLLLNKKDGCFIGSARGLSDSSFSNFKDFISNSNLAVFATGHQEAFGASFEETNISKFIEYSNEKLKDFDFSSIYKVDFIFNFNELNGQDILNIASLKYVWG